MQQFMLSRLMGGDATPKQANRSGPRSDMLGADMGYSGFNAMDTFDDRPTPSPMVLKKKDGGADPRLNMLELLEAETPGRPGNTSHFAESAFLDEDDLVDRDASAFEEDVYRSYRSDAHARHQHELDLQRMLAEFDPDAMLAELDEYHGMSRPQKSKGNQPPQHHARTHAGSHAARRVSLPQVCSEPNTRGQRALYGNPLLTSSPNSRLTFG